MTLIDRSTERRPLIADGTVPDMRSRLRLPTPALIAIAAALVALAGLVGWTLADRTAPSLCMDTACQMTLTPHRDGQVTVRHAVPGEQVREAKVPAACMHSGPADAGPECPAWIWDWAPGRA